MKNQIKKLLSYSYRRAQTVAQATLRLLGRDKAPKTPVVFVSEDANWAIHWVAQYIHDGIEANHPGTMSITTKPSALHQHVVHFGSQYMWQAWRPHLPKSNRFVVSFFHGKREDSPQVAKHIDDFVDSVHELDAIVTGAGIMKRRLISWGVPEDKIFHIPIGVDTTLFVPPTQEQRRQARQNLGLPKDRLVVGSFQKDGVGWGDGMEPKLIKGPDIFVESVERLAQSHAVHVLLTGPARGYVKAQLERRNIPYTHVYRDNYLDLVECYHALDLYLMTSREEGGPMALMESMATHTPLVSTRAGQAEDLMVDMEHGALVDSFSPDDIAEKANDLLRDTVRLEKICIKARERVLDWDWKIIAEKHYTQVYTPLLARIGNS